MKGCRFLALPYFRDGPLPCIRRTSKSMPLSSSEERSTLPIEHLGGAFSSKHADFQEVQVPRRSDERIYEQSGAFDPDDRMDSNRPELMNVLRYFIRDVPGKGSVRIDHVDSRLQYAYTSTKGLPLPWYRRHRGYLVHLWFEGLTFSCRRGVVLWMLNGVMEGG